jgi:hypothetical protein
MSCRLYVLTSVYTYVHTKLHDLVVVTVHVSEWKGHALQLVAYMRGLMDELALYTGEGSVEQMDGIPLQKSDITDLSETANTRPIRSVTKIRNNGPIRNIKIHARSEVKEREREGEGEGEREREGERGRERERRRFRGGGGTRE